MEFDFNMRGRRSIRLKGHDYSAPGDYFITICAYKMECVFGEVSVGRMRMSAAGEIAGREWRNTETIRPEVKLGPFVVMPNHIHGIISIHVRRGESVARPDLVHNIRRDIMPSGSLRASQRDAPTLEPETIGSIIGQFKSLSTKKIRATDLTGFHWQRNYYEHIVRSKSEFEQIKKYILENPLKWPEDPDNPINR